MSQVYAFGSPPVGNATYCNAYEALLGEKTYICANYQDIVVFLSFFVLKNYRNVGCFIYIDNKGTPRCNPSESELLEYNFRGFRSRLYAARFFPSVIFHSIINYENALRKALGLKSLSLWSQFTRKLRQSYGRFFQ